jgi:hypothetical protein
MNLLRAFGLPLLWLVMCNASFAQDLRDPTQAPAESAVGGALGGAGNATNDPGVTVVSRDGQPYLVVGTRLVAVGQKVGSAKLERITETEIWFKEAGVVRKVPRFAGIQRSAVKEASACQPVKPRAKVSHKSSASATSPKPISTAKRSVAPVTTSPTAAPCAVAQQ